MKTYYIYHIPSYVHKDGSIGKIGCTSRPVKQRVRMQKYSEYELLEEHTDEYIASIRELELQREYGYLVDCIPYHKGKYSENGKKRGQQCVESGWINDFQKLGNKTSSEKTKKIILQYDLDGNFIKEWDCGVNELSRKYGFNVGAVCVGKKHRKTISGYQWKYKTSDDYPKQIGKFSNETFQKVVQKDLQGNIIKIWDNQTEAAQSLNCTVQLISRVCNGRGKTAKGYKWEKYV